MEELVKITVSGVLEDLKNGYTRLSSDKNYLGDGKSIQEKYNLSRIDVSRLFKHEKLKRKRTAITNSGAFTLIDDTSANGTVLKGDQIPTANKPDENPKPVAEEDLKTREGNPDEVLEKELPEDDLENPFKEPGDENGEGSGDGSDEDSQDNQDDDDDEPEWLKD